MAINSELKLAFSVKDYKENFLPRYAKEPLLFAREICAIEPGGWQIPFLQNIVADLDSQRGAHIALASGHETGKTFIACVLMFWGISIFPDCHIYCTSATSDQLKSRLWSYMRRIINESAISSWFDVDSEKVVFKHLPGNFIKAQAWSSDKPQSWAGEHSFAAWGVFDECSDIADEIFNAWSGSSFKRNALTLIMGQPLHRKGKLFEAFNGEKEFWRGIHLSSTESPFSSKEFIEQARLKHGEDSDYYRMRVLGKFPKADSSQLFPDANDKKPEEFSLEAGDPPPVAGLDIAAGGNDKTILVFRAGCKVLAFEKYDTGNFEMLENEIVQSMLRRGCGVVAADITSWGYGLVERLSHRKEITTVPVHGSKKALNSKKYHNRRSEMYGRLSESWDKLRFLRAGASEEILKDLGKQLELIRVNYDRDMRMFVLPKLEIKEQLGESPDLADALAYSFMVSHEHGQTPEANNDRMLEIRRIQMNSNPYRR